MASIAGVADIDLTTINDDGPAAAIVPRKKKRSHAGKHRRRPGKPNASRKGANAEGAPAAKRVKKTTARRESTKKTDEDEQEADTTIATAGAGAALTEPIRAGEIKKGMTVMLKGKPCKVIEVTTSKTGKHGHAKANITGLDIFTGKKYMDISPTSHNMTKPVVKTANWTLTDIQHSGELSLMDDGGNQKEDMNLPADVDLAAQIKDNFAKCNAAGIELYLTITSAMGIEQITAYKTSQPLA